MTPVPPPEDHKPVTASDPRARRRPQQAEYDRKRNATPERKEYLRKRAQDRQSGLASSRTMGL